MKEYTMPSMSVRIFSNLTETAENTVASVATPYVTGLASISENNKAQVTMNNMKQITKFTF